MLCSSGAATHVSCCPPRPQRPLLLSGHERALNQIKFNREGDLIFSCSKDNVVNVWYSHNGERIGTYEGNNGSVWSIDPDCESGGYRERARRWGVRGAGGDEQGRRRKARKEEAR